jgi:hypothetical protein
MPGRQRRGTSAFLIEQVPSQARWSAQIVENAARSAVRFIGWIGMIGVTLWLLLRGLSSLSQRPDKT